MADVRDVASAIMSSVGECTAMKLQKLLYYCQGWHLAWDDELLFDSDIEAWANGPVVPDVFSTHKGRFWLDASWQHGGNPKKLSKHQRHTVEAICDVYSDWTGCQMSEATHTERPWLEAREGHVAGEIGKQKIDVDVMRDYFTNLRNSIG